MSPPFLQVRACCNLALQSSQLMISQSFSPSLFQLTVFGLFAVASGVEDMSPGAALPRMTSPSLWLLGSLESQEIEFRAKLVPSKKIQMDEGVAEYSVFQ